MVTSNHLSNYIDKNDVAGYAKDAVEWALDEGLLYGDSRNQILPEKGATRAELAAILVRYYERFVNE